MPAHKSHHYVPQMYMRLFSTDGARVGVFAMASRKFIPHAPIRGQACRDYFYGKNRDLEIAFGTLEARAARLFADVIENFRLPSPGSEEHELLVFYLGMQHARTMSAAEQYNETAEKLAKAMLRRKAELDGNESLLAALDKVRIRRADAVSEVVRYAMIGANLLTDLAFVLVRNDSNIHFIASDAPVVLHNQLFEGQHISVTGYASVGLQLFLPLGPRLALHGYDAAAYNVQCASDGIVHIGDAEDIRLINDLQWEAAHAVLLVAPDTPKDELQACAANWPSERRAEQVVVLEEVVERSDTEVRTRQGNGRAPSTIALDLTFVTPRLPAPLQLGAFKVPPFRNQELVDRTDLAFAARDELNEMMGRH